MLAPDQASKKAGKDLASPVRWTSKGANELALWGEAQGSGSKPYQTQVDLTTTAFKCSCPSRKFPCKHGLGLMLFYNRNSADFKDIDPPTWVTEWLKKRTQKEEKKATQEEKPVDEAAQAKRQQARNSKVADGIEELRLWIKDIVRNGILLMPEKNGAWFENMSKRMVDAQAPGLANMVRALGDTGFYQEGWQHKFLNQLVNIYLVLEGFKNKDALNELLQEDIRSLIGFTQNQDELKEKEGITDTWLVLSKQVIEQDQLTIERNWLYGLTHKQYALVLQFRVRGQLTDINLSAGLFLQAELSFYPSTVPMRAIIKRQMNAVAAPLTGGFENWQQVLEQETITASKMPVRNDRPYIIRNLRPVNDNGQWWLQDTKKDMIALKNSNKNIWTLLSYSGGQALDMAVVGREDEYEVVGLWHNNEYRQL